MDNQSAVRFASDRAMEKGLEQGHMEGRMEALSESARIARESGLSDELIKKIFGTRF